MMMIGYAFSGRCGRFRWFGHSTWVLNGHGAAQGRPVFCPCRSGRQGDLLIQIRSDYVLFLANPNFDAKNDPWEYSKEFLSHYLSSIGPVLLPNCQPFNIRHLGTHVLSCNSVRNTEIRINFLVMSTSCRPFDVRLVWIFCNLRLL